MVSMPRPIVWHGAAWVHGLLSLEPVFWTYRVAAVAAELKRQSIVTTRRRAILAGLSKREPTPQGVSPYRKGFVACLCAFRPQRSHRGQGIPICLDRGASGLALRSDRHQGAVLQRSWCASSSRNCCWAVCCVSHSASTAALAAWVISVARPRTTVRYFGAAGTSGALGHGRLGLSGATAALRGTAAAWGTSWWPGGHDGTPLCLGTVGSVG